MAKKKQQGKILDLDALRPEPIKVRLGGKEHDLRAYTLDSAKRFAELQSALKGADEAAKLEALREMLAFIAPSAAEHIGSLTPEQQNRFLEHWANEGREEVKQEEEEAAAVAADPTSPG